MEIDQEEMQHLGFLGIYKEAYKLIFKWRKIFTQITLTLILPLIFIILAPKKSQILHWRILHHELYHVVYSEYKHFKAIYFTFVLVFSLLSTSAVVYTIASVYTSREITFKKVMCVVPRVWKRLIVTFLCAFFAFWAHNMVFAPTLHIMWGPNYLLADFTTIGTIILVIILILYAIGFVYLSIVWQLACIVSVLEDSYGIKAMIKSKGLIQGKMCLAIAIFLMLNVSFFIIYFGFLSNVDSEMSFVGVARVLGTKALFLLLLLKMILFGLVVQTVFYFVCKSYHHENIDKSALSNHLEVYLGDCYVPLKAKDVKMMESHV